MSTEKFDSSQTLMDPQGAPACEGSKNHENKKWSQSTQNHLKHAKKSFSKNRFFSENLKMREVRGPYHGVGVKKSYFETYPIVFQIV